MDKTKVKKLAKQCAQSKQKMNLLKESYDDAKTQLQGVMEKEGIDQFNSEYGKFSLSEYSNYEYSDEVKKLEEKLKNKKAKEREEGIAENDPRVVLRFNPVKKDD